MGNHVRIVLAALLGLLAGACFAWDVWEWTDATGDSIFSTPGNWSVGGVPQTAFPPPLDETIWTGTQPVLQFSGDSVVTNPAGSTYTLNWINFAGPNKSYEVALGKGTRINLFGGLEAALWVGGNFPNGQRVHLTSGIFSGLSTCTRADLRFGAGVYRAEEDNAAPSVLLADGPDVRFENLTLNMGGRFSTCCFTNGATMKLRNEMCSLNFSHVNGEVCVTGEGSSIVGNEGQQMDLMMGDGNSTYDVPAGALRVTNGGVVTNVAGYVGNRGCNYSVLIDKNGCWTPHYAVTIGSCAQATNNLVSVTDGGVFAYPDVVPGHCQYVLVGGQGDRNRLYVENATFKSQNVLVGCVADSEGNVAEFRNASVDVQSASIGASTGQSAGGGCDNTLRFVDCAIGTAQVPRMRLEFAYNRTDAESRSNTVEFVRSSWYNPATYFGIGGWTGTTNSNYNTLLVRDHSRVSGTSGGDGFIIGMGGHGNRLVVTEGSEFFLGEHCGICVGWVTADENCHGNELHVGDSSTVNVPEYLQLTAPLNRIVVDNGTLTAQYLRLYYYYSKVLGRTVDSPDQADAEGVTFDTRITFKGEAPSFVVPREDSGDYNGFNLRHHVIVRYELPEAPYAQAPMRSSYEVVFNDGCRYEFDFSKVGAAGGRYPLAEAIGSAPLSISDEELANLNAVVAAAAAKAGRRASVSVVGKKLVCKVGSSQGFVLIVQ